MLKCLQVPVVKKMQSFDKFASWDIDECMGSKKYVTNIEKSLTQNNVFFTRSHGFDDENTISVQYFCVMGEIKFALEYDENILDDDNSIMELMNKTQLCIRNNIPLLRIHYSNIDTITDIIAKYITFFATHTKQLTLSSNPNNDYGYIVDITDDEKYGPSKYPPVMYITKIMPHSIRISITDMGFHVSIKHYTFYSRLSMVPSHMKNSLHL